MQYVGLFAGYIPTATVITQSIEATEVSVATITVHPIYRKSLSATEVSAATCVRKTKKLIIATSLEVATCVRKAKKPLAAAAAVTSTCLRHFTQHIALAATAVAIASISNKRVVLKLLAATASVVASAIAAPTYRTTQAATVGAVGTITKKCKKLIGATVVAMAGCIRKTKKPLQVSSVVQAVENEVVLFARVFSIQATVVAASSETFHAGTPVKVKDLISLFIAFKR